MELIVLIALIAAGIAIRKQGQRLKVLEQDFAHLRARIAGGEPVVAAAASDAPAVHREAEPPVHSEEIGPEEIATAQGPWARAVAHSADAAVEAPVEAAMETPAESGEAPAIETRQAPKRDLETTLGTRWAVWVGGLALALGGVFLVRYSIEAGIFGPRVRLAGAALFGLALAAAGEVARRRGFRAPAAGVAGAYVPAILTAAATFTLFSAVYAAHGIYGFIGPAAAFTLLAAIALATMALSLLHGQALAGLGLLGSYATPVLVSSEAPAVWTLFSYLALVLAAAVAVASLRRWRFLSGAAFLGAGLWSLAYLGTSFGMDAAPVAVLNGLGIAVLAGLWLARAGEGERRPDPASLIAAFFLFVVTTFLARGIGGVPLGGGYWAAGLLAAALAAAAWRERAAPLLHAAGLAMLPFAIAMLIFPYVGARLGRSYSPPTILALGLVTVAAGNLMTGWAAFTGGWTGFLVGTFVIGSGAGLLNGETQKVIMMTIPRERAGLASGISTTARFCGILIGFAALNTMFAFGVHMVLKPASFSTTETPAVNARVVEALISGDLRSALVSSTGEPLGITLASLRHFQAMAFSASLATAALIAALSAPLVWWLLRRPLSGDVPSAATR